jgi:hypothetical protein
MRNSPTLPKKALKEASSKEYVLATEICGHPNCQEHALEDSGDFSVTNQKIEPMQNEDSELDVSTSQLNQQLRALKVVFS